jgi:PPOX class probable F420-dependent enzyme
MATNRRQQIQLSPDEQAAFFRERKKAALATIDKDGFPHVVAMNYVARDGAFYMTSYGKAQKVVNIRRNPRVALMIEAGDEYAELRGVMIRGRCEILDDEASVKAAFAARATAQADAAPVQRAEARGAQDRPGEGGQLGPPQARRTILTRRTYPPSVGCLALTPARRPAPRSRATARCWR